MTMKYILLIILFAALIQCWNNRVDCYEKEGLTYAASTQANRLDRLDFCAILGIAAILRPSSPTPSNVDADPQRTYNNKLLMCYVIYQKRKKCDKEMNGPWPGNPYIWDKRYGK